MVTLSEAWLLFEFLDELLLYSWRNFGRLATCKKILYCCSLLFAHGRRNNFYSCAEFYLSAVVQEGKGVCVCLWGVGVGEYNGAIMILVLVSLLQSQSISNFKQIFWYLSFSSVSECALIALKGSV